MLSRFSCVQLFVTLWTAAHQAPLSLGFSRQEFSWSGLPCPPPRNLPDPRIKPTTPALQADVLPLSHWGTLQRDCCCQVASVISDSVRPPRGQPTRLPRPGDSPGKNIGVGCHFLLQCVKVKSLTHVRLVATPWTAAHQAPPSMGFFQARVLEWVAIAFSKETAGVIK